MKKVNRKKELCFLPVYINKTKLLDINSILFDGYSEFSEVNYHNEEVKNSTQKGKVNAGVGMSIFNLGSHLESESLKNNNVISNVSLKRIQTSSSLLANTIKILKKNRMLKYVPSKAGELIEIKGEFKNNSLIDLLEQISEMTNLAKLASKLKGTNEDSKKCNNMIDDIRTLKQMLSSKSGNKSELVFETKSIIYVAKIDDSCLYNCDLNDIYNNQLYFLGQIKGMYKKYKFFSDTPLSKFNPKQIDEFIDGLKPVVENGIFDIDFEVMTNNNEKTVVELDIVAIYRKIE